MNIYVYQQLFNLFVFTITGIVIGIVFDVFRITRKSFKTPDYITYIEDIVFWILTGFILLFTIFTFNNGEIRIYIFAGIILGLIIYLLTLSKYFIKISVSVLVFVKKLIYVPIHTIFSFIKNFIFRPFSFILQKIKIKFTKFKKNSYQETEVPNFPNICNKIDE